MHTQAKKNYPLPNARESDKKVNNWGGSSGKEDYSMKLEFLNRHRQQYDWDNDELTDDAGLMADDVAHPDITAEIPGIELESEQIVPGPAVETVYVTDAEQAAAAAENAGFDDIAVAAPTTVDEVIIIEYDSDPTEPHQDNDVQPDDEDDLDLESIVKKIGQSDRGRRQTTTYRASQGNVMRMAIQT